MASKAGMAGEIGVTEKLYLTCKKNVNKNNYNKTKCLLIIIYIFRDK